MNHIGMSLVPMLEMSMETLGMGQGGGAPYVVVYFEVVKMVLSRFSDWENCYIDN